MMTVKPIRAWIVVDSKGKLLRFANGEIAFSRRSDAKAYAVDHYKERVIPVMIVPVEKKK